jgi:hypothetical protein
MTADARIIVLSHGGVSRPSIARPPVARPAVADEARRNGQRRGEAFAFASGAYGVPFGSDLGYDPTVEALPPPGVFSAPFYRPYVKPAQLTCIRPRLIIFGHRAPKSQFPHVVYGTSLPCGFKGV